MSQVLDIHDLEEMSREMLDLRPDGWTKPLHFDLGKLTEECGEVAECLNKSKKTKEDLGAELSDLISVCFVIALKSGIDLNEAIQSKQRERIAKLVMRFHEGVHPRANSQKVNE